jgi:hypothetical protein
LCTQTCFTKFVHFAEEVGVVLLAETPLRAGFRIASGFFRLFGEFCAERGVLGVEGGGFDLEEELLGVGTDLGAGAGFHELFDLLPVFAVDAESWVGKVIPSRNLRCSSLVHRPLLLLAPFERSYIFESCRIVQIDYS